ncbi:MAG: hypothetical protein ACTSXX_01565 [Candidatus Baldrarchaeia archaeon]
MAGERGSDKRAKDVLRFNPDEIPPGTCRIMRWGDKLVAVCKDEKGDKIRIYEVVGEER